jgi:molecular chaperone GrpE
MTAVSDKAEHSDRKDDMTTEDQTAPETAEQAAADPAGTTPPGDAELAALRQERDEFRDRFMRALAESENVRKRADRDRREAEMYGATRLARDLLPVYDNLRRALDAATEEQRANGAALIEGVELTLKELVKTLGRHGVTPIVPAVGDTFDPAQHQAMFEAPLPGTRAGQIIQVMTEGFLIHDRLLRPAQVGVSSNTES